MIEKIPQEKFREPLRRFVERANEITDSILEIATYGSVARGEADSRSDVDVFVLLSKSLDAETENKLFGLEIRYTKAGIWLEP